MAQTLSPALRSLVKQSVALLGQVIGSEMGRAGYERVERVRQRMAALRRADGKKQIQELRRTIDELARLPRQERRDFARAYTLMLELMNACENAYRSHRLKRTRARPPVSHTSGGGGNAIIYVLTAHPTEARAPANIAAFHRVQSVLLSALERSEGSSIDSSERITLTVSEKEQLLHWLEIAWKSSIVRSKKPRVQDEAEHIYSTLLREETLATLLEFARDVSPVYVRSWVGGDKDGHPGVNEKTFRDSLQISRRGMLEFIHLRLHEVSGTLECIRSSDLSLGTSRAVAAARALAHIRAGDGRRVERFRMHLRRLIESYLREVRVLHPALSQLIVLTRTFPALLVPLEIRESSEVLMAGGKASGPIRRMLRTLRQISAGGDPRWYCRGFIISLAESMDHLRMAAKFIRAEFGEVRLPVVPLFEQAQALRDSVPTVKAMIRDPAFRKAREKHWDGYVEVMVGYSDSAKESGVLPSRRQIAETMAELDRLFEKEKVKPLFFQGSGGSVDRGGGSIQEQTAWWPKGALKNYKVTIQGEMVERSLASPEIARGQLLRISDIASRRLKDKRPPRAPVAEEAVRRFADRIATHYRNEIQDPAFLRVVEKATPYSYLNVLKMGSRPTKRTRELTVSGLRAIPWVLCWTQTRILFPSWWGVGTAWKQTSAADRRALIRAYAENPLFGTYVRSLGFTLAKVELAVFRLYLEHSGFPESEVERVFDRFRNELQAAHVFARQVMKSSRLLGWRPWLQESITLRSPMIHPLNLLQLIAVREKDFELLRLTVAGVASGMMTTG